MKRQMSIRRMMALVIVASIMLVPLRYVVQVMFYGPPPGKWLRAMLTLTMFSKEYNEESFLKVKVGMTTLEVEQLLGSPLRKLPWPEGSRDVMWTYSESPFGHSFLRRWVSFRDNRVDGTIADYWSD